MKPPIERRTTGAPVRLEKRADGKEVITGYAAVFFDENDPGSEYAIWDDMRERLMPGCFDRAMREDDCRALFNHDPSAILGRSGALTLALSVDRKGLRYEITPPQTRMAEEVCENIRNGNLTGSSFAFIADGRTYREIKTDAGTLYIREINSVQLFDVGPVTYPAYASTTTGLRAAGDAGEARKELQEWLERRGLQGRLAGYRARAVNVD